VKGYGGRDRDGQPSSSRDESDRGNVAGELAVLDEEVDRPPYRGLLLAREVVGATNEDPGRDSLNGVTGGEEDRPNDESGSAQPRRYRREVVKQFPDGQGQERGQDELPDVNDQPAVDIVRDSLVGAVTAGVRVEKDQYRPDERPGVDEIAAYARLGECPLVRPYSRRPFFDSSPSRSTAPN
jgi:hypothetical protein